MRRVNRTSILIYNSSHLSLLSLSLSLCPCVSFHFRYICPVPLYKQLCGRDAMAGKEILLKMKVRLNFSSHLLSWVSISFHVCSFGFLWWCRYDLLDLQYFLTFLFCFTCIYIIYTRLITPRFCKFCVIVVDLRLNSIIAFFIGWNECIVSLALGASLASAFLEVIRLDWVLNVYKYKDLDRHNSH